MKIYRCKTYPQSKKEENMYKLYKAEQACFDAAEETNTIWKVLLIVAAVIFTCLVGIFVGIEVIPESHYHPIC